MKTSLMRLFALAIFFSLSFSVTAQEPEPQITITQKDDETHYEYRVNGILTEIKVVPKVGPTYYLVPQDGGGWIKEEESQILIPKWVIFSW